MEQAAALDDERPEVRVGADLLADPLARDHVALDADEGEALAGVLQLGHVRGRVGELEVADLAEVAVDGLVGDQPLDRLVAVERLLVERAAGVLAVAPDELAWRSTCSRRGRCRRCAWTRPSRACAPRGA